MQKLEARDSCAEKVSSTKLPSSGGMGITARLDKQRPRQHGGKGHLKRVRISLRKTSELTTRSTEGTANFVSAGELVVKKRGHR